MRQEPYRTGRKLLFLCLIALVFGPTPAFAQDYMLTWGQNPEPDVVGYKLFYRAGGPIESTGLYDQVIDVGNVTQYPVTGLQDGTVYYFSIKAYDLAGAESPFSADACTSDEPIPPPEPDPEPEPDPAPIPEPDPAPIPEPEPDPVPIPEPEPEPEPIPEPDPVPIPDPAPEPEPVTPPDIQGDANRDGVVDAVDLVAVVQASQNSGGLGSFVQGIQASGTYAIDEDLNGDGIVDGADLSIVVSNYGAKAAVDALYSPSITASAGAGGTVFPEGAVQVAGGASRCFLITPESGYILEEVLVDGLPVILEEGQYSYCFDGVERDHTLEVRFAATAELADELALRMEFDGDLLDASGWENHGSSQTANTPEFIADRYGRQDKACQFDGLDDFVRIESSPDFKLPEYTLAAWVYGMRDYNFLNPQYIASNNLSDTDDVVGMFAYADSLCASGFRVPRAEDVLCDKENQWHHLTVVRNTWKVQFYLDGVYVGEMRAKYYRGRDSHDLIIGARTSGDAVPGYGFFKGIIDDVRLYNHPLGAERIQDMVVFPGDVDRDGDVDQADLLLLGDALGAIEGDPNRWNPSADFNKNGQIDVGDLVWAAWGFDAGLINGLQKQIATGVQPTQEDSIAADPQESTDVEVKPTTSPVLRTR